MTTMVLVLASRGWEDPQPVEARLSDLYERTGGDMFVVHTDRRGADRFAAQWCDRWHVPHKAFAADFEHHGRLAPKRRNWEMLEFVVSERADGADVEAVVFRLPGDRSADELDRLVLTARGYGISGRVVRAHAA